MLPANATGNNMFYKIEADRQLIASEVNEIKASASYAKVKANASYKNSKTYERQTVVPGGSRK
jgi:hypothetical protein